LVSLTSLARSPEEVTVKSVKKPLKDKVFTCKMIREDNYLGVAALGAGDAVGCG
jgi:hypothetical protein